MRTPSLHKRLKSLESQAHITANPPCPCRGPWPTIDFSALTTEELKALIALDDLAFVHPPLTCLACGEPGILQDYSRLTAPQQKERESIFSAWRGRDAANADLMMAIDAIRSGDH